MWFFVPETKGRTLEEMDELFGTTGLAASDDERKRRIERDIGLLALLGEEDAFPSEPNTLSDETVEKPKPIQHTETTTLPRHNT